MSSETIHLAQVSEWGQAPVYTTAPHPPEPSESEVQIRVKAAAIHQVVRSRTSGKHYSAKILPHIPGTDGTGLLRDGTPVYFNSMTPTGGATAEVINLPRTNVKPLPEGADPIQVAASVNPGMSSWMAVKTRTEGLKPGFTTLIMGVTSASGRLAVSFARTLGAGTIIGVARNEAQMKEMSLDGFVVLKDNPDESDWAKIGEVDVILDYLYGAPTEALLKSLKPGKKIQYVQIGSLAGQVMSFPSAPLRSADITMRGSGPGAWSLKDLNEQLPFIIDAIVKCPEQKVKVEKLADIEKAWADTSTRERIVLVP